MGRFKKIYILAPAGGVTGGPELLHQLGATLRSFGQDAYISYVPSEMDQSCPEAYRKYKVPIAQVEDEFGNAVVMPEVYAGTAMHFGKAQPIVWWLSVDNYSYQGAFGRVWLRKRWLELKLVLKGNRPWRISSLRKCEHLTQSHYARQFLSKHGIPSVMLSDFLSEEHFSSNQKNKLRQVAYNPAKGFETTRRLVALNPDIKFVPIEGLTASGVKTLLESSMIYIDFGHHPGKDRMPREAAMAGCCIITGLQGAAAFSEDVSIPAAFKLDEHDPKFHEKFRRSVLDAFEKFDETLEQFSFYRNRIALEKIVFESEVKNVFV